MYIKEAHYLIAFSKKKMHNFSYLEKCNDYINSMNNTINAICLYLKLLKTEHMLDSLSHGMSEPFFIITSLGPVKRYGSLKNETQSDLLTLFKLEPSLLRNHIHVYFLLFQLVKCVREKEISTL